MEIWPQKLLVYRDDFITQEEYDDFLADCENHYGYYWPVDGGMVYFEFETEYTTWKNQK